MSVYRSVKIVFQNSTAETMTVHGCAVLRGQWTDKMEPSQGAEVLSQSSQTWGTESQTVSSGTSGYIRLGSVPGYTTLSWGLPWVGAFEFTAECPEGLHADWQVNDRQPDAVVVFVAVTPKQA